MYKTSKRFLFWVIYIPLGIVSATYILDLVFRLNSWWFAEPNSYYASSEYAFFGERHSLSILIHDAFIGLSVLSAIGLMLWFVGYYFAKRQSRVETKNSDIKL